MKKNQYVLAKIVCLLVGVFVFADCVTAQTKSSSKKITSKKITIEGIPSAYNGMYGETVLFIDDGKSEYITVAWSAPVLIKNGSATNVLQIYAEPNKIDKPFHKDGKYRVSFTIRKKPDQYQGTLPWEGSTSAMNITKESTIIQWSEFVEEFG